MKPEVRSTPSVMMLQIEIKRSCYADVERHAPNAGFERVQRALQAMLAALAVHVRAECSTDRA